MWVDAALLPGLGVGEYVLVHAGLALEQVSSEDADELLSFFASVDDALEASTE